MKQHADNQPDETQRQTIRAAAYKTAAYMGN